MLNGTTPKIQHRKWGPKSTDKINIFRACDVTSEPWEESGSFCNLTKQKVGCLVKFRPCLTFYELKELKKCLLKDLENGMSSYEDKQLLKSCSIYKELFVKWAWILARLCKGGLFSESFLLWSFPQKMCQINILNYST